MDVLLHTVGQMQQTFEELLDSLDETDDIEHDLRELARRLITTVIRPEVMQLRRIVIAEAERFPEIARVWYERGPERTVLRLAEHFARLAARGVLSIDDAVLAGHHFNWLVLSIPLNKLTFIARGESVYPGRAAAVRRRGGSGVPRGVRPSGRCRAPGIRPSGRRTDVAQVSG